MELTIGWTKIQRFSCILRNIITAFLWTAIVLLTTEVGDTFASLVFCLECGNIQYASLFCDTPYSSRFCFNSLIKSSLFNIHSSNQKGNYRLWIIACIKSIKKDSQLIKNQLSFMLQYSVFIVISEIFLSHPVKMPICLVNTAFSACRDIQFPVFCAPLVR